MYRISKVPNLTFLHSVQRKLNWSPLLQCDLAYHWESLTRRTSPYEHPFFETNTITKYQTFEMEVTKTLHKNEVQTLSRHNQIGCFDNFFSLLEDEVAFM